MEHDPRPLNHQAGTLEQLDYLLLCVIAATFVISTFGMMMFAGLL